MLAQGVAASPGAAKGAIVFRADDAVAGAARARDVILVRPFTEADDVARLSRREGGPDVRRRQGVPRRACGARHGRAGVTGARRSRSTWTAREVRLNGEVVLREGDLLAIDGSTGRITTADVPLVEPEVDEHFQTVLEWADALRRLGVRTNADTPEDARKAREFGAEGIGLCRTEHMFFGEDRHEKMVRVILADDDASAGRARGVAAAAAGRLRGHFRGDGRSAGDDPPARPAAARVPSHPAPHRQRARARAPRAAGRPRRSRAHLERVRSLHEINPMLGTRGYALGILAPAIYEMQVEAIVAAVRAVRGGAAWPRMPRS